MFQFSAWCTRTGWDVYSMYSMHSMYSWYWAGGGGDRSWNYPVHKPTQPRYIQHAGGRVLCLIIVVLLYIQYQWFKPRCIQHESGVLFWNHTVSNMKAESYVETMQYPTWKRSFMLKPCSIQHEIRV